MLDGRRQLALARAAQLKARAVVEQHVEPRDIIDGLAVGGGMRAA